MAISNQLVILQIKLIPIHDEPQANVLIDENGMPRICDFGLARIAMEYGKCGTTTTTQYNGTVRYLALKLAKSYESFSTRESNIWALGCLGLEASFYAP